MLMINLFSFLNTKYGKTIGIFSGTVKAIFCLKVNKVEKIEGQSYGVKPHLHFPSWGGGKSQLHNRVLECLNNIRPSCLPTILTALGQLPGRSGGQYWLLPSLIGFIDLR
jgi:hypothetical protein